MPVVFIPLMLQRLAGGQKSVEVDGATVGEVLAILERSFPGLGERLSQPNVAVAVDGEVTPLGRLEAVGPASEIHFVTAIKGG